MMSKSRFLKKNGGTAPPNQRANADHTDTAHITAHSTAHSTQHTAHSTQHTAQTQHTDTFTDTAHRLQHTIKHAANRAMQPTRRGTVAARRSERGAEYQACMDGGVPSMHGSSERK